MPRAKRNEVVLPMLGASAKQINRELESFSHAARVLSSNRRRLIAKYPKKWVGICAGKVEVTAASLDALLSKLRKRGLSPSSTIIRYIDANPRKLIL